MPKRYRQRTRHNSFRSAAQLTRDPVQNVLNKSHQVFSALFDERREPWILLAQQGFDKEIRCGALSPDEANRILNTASLLTALLKFSEERYKSERDVILERIEDNTNLKTALVLSVTVAAAFSALTPFVGTLLQPLADELFKPAPPADTTLKQAPVGLNPITINTYNNFYSTMKADNDAFSCPVVPPSPLPLLKHDNDNRPQRGRSYVWRKLGRYGW